MTLPLTDPFTDQTRLDGKLFRTFITSTNKRCGLGMMTINLKTGMNNPGDYPKQLIPDEGWQNNCHYSRTDKH